MSKIKGFTLLEILLVIAVIGILSAIVIVAINPTRQLSQVRNAQRRSSLRTLDDAIYQYNIDTQSQPSGLTSWYKDICPSGGGVYCVDLNALVPTYITEIPTEPDGVTQYRIALNSITNSISLKSGSAEQNVAIAINPVATVSTFAKQSGGVNPDTGNGITNFPDGSSGIIGYFQGTAVFGQGEVNETTLISNGSNDIFIAKYNANGTLGWVKKIGSTAWDTGRKIASYDDGSSVIVGDIGGTTIFGQGEPNQTTLTYSGGFNDIFIAKYNTNGTLAWAKRAGGPGSEYGYDIASFDDGSAIISGYFGGGTSIFGQGEVNQTSLVAISGSFDMYISKYNADGTLAWAKRAGGNQQEYASYISSFPDGSGIVTGEFGGTATFGQGEANQTILNAAGGSTDSDVYIAKYNADGTLAWAKRAGGTSIDMGYAVASFLDGSSLITGVFRTTSVFGEGEANQTSVISEGNQDIFIAKYNADGTLAWAKRAGGTSSDYGVGAGVYNDGSSVIIGEFRGTVVLGLGEINQTTLISQGASDIFIAKYDIDGNLIWAKRAGGSSFDSGYGVTTFSDGSTGITGYFASTAIFGQGDLNQTSLTVSGSQSDMFFVKYNSDGRLD